MQLITILNVFNFVYIKLRCKNIYINKGIKKNTGNQSKYDDFLIFDQCNFIRKNYGVGLIEVLISLLVITIGMFGMARIHSSSLQYNHESYFQLQAIFLTTDLMDRIQANGNLAKISSAYQIGLDDFVFPECVTGDYPNNCELNSCTPEEIAVYDILQWKFHMTCQIPGSRGSISFKDIDQTRMFTIRLNFENVQSMKPLSDVLLRGVL